MRESEIEVENPILTDITYIFLVIDHRRGSTQLFYSCTGNRNRPLPAPDPENKVCCQIASKKQDGRNT